MATGFRSLFNTTSEPYLLDRLPQQPPITPAGVVDRDEDEQIARPTAKKIGALVTEARTTHRRKQSKPKRRKPTVKWSSGIKKISKKTKKRAVG